MRSEEEIRREIESTKKVVSAWSERAYREYVGGRGEDALFSVDWAEKQLKRQGALEWVLNDE